MSSRSAEQIEKFVATNAHKLDMSVQFLGDEPNSFCKPWDTATVRACIVASWPYEQAAGNQSIPAVYKSINEGHADFLCDRFYLPATRRDLRLFEKAGVPVFGIESKHQLRDFDVVGTSISYPLLCMSFVKMLTMSDIPARWRERERRGLENFPMVMVGGQAYGAPEVLAPIVDVWWLGEVEEEPGNPGIATVMTRIEQLKTAGLWQTKRLECYQILAREFNFLYFPRFIDVQYGYEDRTEFFGGKDNSKQVVSYTANLAGMRMPLTKRIVKNLDNIAPLDNQPLLYADPGFSGSDLEVGRGCPAWCSFCALCLSGDTQFITRQGVRRLDACLGETVEVWNQRGWQKAEVSQFGQDWLDEITLAPAFYHPGGARGGHGWRRSSSTVRVTHRATALHRWPLADGGETHHVAVGDTISAEFTTGGHSQDYDDGWLHGYVFGDGTQENSHLGDRSHSYAALLWGAKDRRHHARFARLMCSPKRGGRQGGEGHKGCDRPVCVLSMTDDGRRIRVRMNSQTRLKEYPDAAKSAAYVRGFIEGWADADGVTRYRREDRIRLTSQRPDALSWLEQNAAYGGWILSGHYDRENLETNYGTRKHRLREYGLSRVTAWQVVSIEKEVIKGDVYCAMVSGDGFFTLASGVLTGNTYRQRFGNRIGSGRSAT